MAFYSRFLDRKRQLKERIEEVTQRLLDLEINTVIKPGMTARKIPKPRHALIDVAQQYANALDAITGSADVPREVFATFGTFDRLRNVASAALDRRRAAATAQATAPRSVAYRGVDEEVVLLQRIKDSSDDVKQLLEALRKRGVDVETRMTRWEIEKEQMADLPLTEDERPDRR
jgi:hypothetical protein